MTEIQGEVGSECSLVDERDRELSLNQLMSRLAFVLAVCEADMSLTSKEKGSLVNSLLGYRTEVRNLFIEPLDMTTADADGLELFEKINDLACLITNVIDGEEYAGSRLFRAQYCARLIEKDTQEVQLLVIGLCFRVLKSDHEDHALSLMLERKEIDCLKKASEILGLTSTRKFPELVKMSLEMLDKQKLQPDD
jgi:hypothetical protein